METNDRKKTKAYQGQDIQILNIINVIYEIASLASLVRRIV